MKMNKEGRKRGFLVLLVMSAMILIVIPSVFASIEGVNISVKNGSLGGGDIIRGTVQIKITHELPALNISSNFQGSLSLIEWLKRNGKVEGSDYSCTTKNCSPAMI